MRSKIMIGLGALVFAGTAFAATDYPSGYTKCAKADGSSCSMSGTRSVALGKSGSFVYSTKTGAFACKTSAFPSSSFTTSAYCSYGGTTSSSSSVSSSTSSAASGVASLSASGGTGKITLSWSKISSGTLQVYRDTDSNPSGRVRIASVSYSTTSYTDSSVTAGKTYYYWIKYTLNGSTVNTNAASAKASSSSTSSSSSSSTASGSSSLCVAGGVIDGKTVDCGGKTIGLSCDSDNEGQPAVITLKNGAVLKNVHIKAGGGAHGISCTAGNCTLQNVTWDEVCEHAAGNYSEGGTYSIYDSTAYQNLDSKAIDGNKPDKFFQDNAYNSKMYVRNFTAVMVQTDGSLSKSGKILRTCGDCSSNKGGRTLDMDGLTVKHQTTSGARVSGPGLSTVVGINTKWDSTVPSPYNVPDKAILRNIKIQDYKSGSPAVCEAYTGSRTHNKSTKIGEQWNTSSCNVSTSDVKSF